MPLLLNMMLIIPFVRGNKNVRKCKTKADRKMVKALDSIPRNERQLGHWLARNVINTKQKLGMGAKNVKRR